MKTNLITIDPFNLFLRLTRDGAVKVKDALSVKVSDVRFTPFADLTWLEGSERKFFNYSDIKKFFKRKRLEVYENNGQLEILMWNERDE